MKKLATVTAVLAALGAIGAQAPANAAVGQCFDGYGRPYGPPQNTDNPNYGMICQAYRMGGHCTHVGGSWAESNCGIGPRRSYDPGPRYYQPRHYNERPRGERRGRNNTYPHPDASDNPAIPAPTPNSAR
jgi:hypothetical protein